MNRQQLIYVENISPTSSEQNLQQYLEKFAPIQAVYFLREKQCTKRSIAAFLRVANDVDRDIIMQRNQQNYRGKRLFMLQADRPHDYQAESTIIVRNITNKISEENLFEHFEDCGKIAFLQIRTDDFAYIAFEDKASVRNAMSKNNQPLKGSSLKIQLLTRNLDIMIVSLDTLASRMPDLYRKMILPIEPRAPTAQQQQQQPVAQPQQATVQQSQPQQQQQQPKPQPNQQKQQQQQSRQQQNQQQQRENQLRQQQQQAQQQRQQQQQQMLQQQRPLPQRQQQQAQQQNLQQQQNQIQSQIQMLKDKATALAGKQQQQQQQRQQSQQQQQPSTSAAAVQPNQQVSAPTTTDTDDVQIVEVMDTHEVIEDDDDDDGDVQIVEKPFVDPIPSEYQRKPGDVLRPVRASELMMKDVEKLKAEEDRRAVWVNNLQPETRRMDLVLYMEQFGDLVHCKIGNSNNCAFTRYAKLYFTSEDAAARAAEYFIHPFQGHYLFVLQCTKYIVEEPGKVFLIDYLSKYLGFEDVVKAFKHIGEVLYIVRLYDNNYKVRIFFADKVDADDVLAVKSIGGQEVKMELYTENMNLRLPKTVAKELKDAREVLDPEKEARLAKVTEIYKQEALDRLATRDYTNPDPKTSPVEVVIYNVPATTTDQQIRRFFKSIGEPTAIRREAIETETHVVRGVERVLVGFRTLSMALQAAEISPERTLNSNNPFIFTAWTQPTMNDQNTLRLFFNKFISIQDIYTGLLHCGPIKYIEKQRAKRALVVFGNGEQGVQNAKQVNFIGDTKITVKDFVIVNCRTAEAESNKLEDYYDDTLQINADEAPTDESPAQTQESADSKPTVKTHGTYVFATWKMIRSLNENSREIVDKFLLSHNVTVACLQAVRLEPPGFPEVKTKHYSWFHTESSQRKHAGTTMVVHNSVMQYSRFGRFGNVPFLSFQSGRLRNAVTVCSMHITTRGKVPYPDPDLVELKAFVDSLVPENRANLMLLGHFKARIGTTDSADVQSLVGDQLAHPTCDVNGIVIKEMLKKNNLKLISSFGPCSSVKQTSINRKRLEQIDHIIMSDIDWMKQPRCHTVGDTAPETKNRMLLLTVNYAHTKQRIALQKRIAFNKMAAKLFAQPNMQPSSAFEQDVANKVLQPTVFATWNVSGCSTPDAQQAIDELLFSNRVTVALLQDTRMKSQRFLTRRYKWYCLGDDSHELQGGSALLVKIGKQATRSNFKPVSDGICLARIPIYGSPLVVYSVFAQTPGTYSQPDKEIVTLANLLELMHPSASHNFIVLGDFNAHIGRGDIAPGARDFIGTHLYHEHSNANGKRIQRILESHGLELVSSFGPRNDEKHTYKRADGTMAQTAHIFMPDIERIGQPVCHSADGGEISDHRILLMTVACHSSTPGACGSFALGLRPVSGGFEPTRLGMHEDKKKKTAPNPNQQPAIVIDDEDEVVVVPAANSSPKKKQQNQGQQNNQQQQRGGPVNRQQQQQQQQQRPGGNRNRNSNSFGDGGPPHRQQQQQQHFHQDQRQQRDPTPPWRQQRNNQGPQWNDQRQFHDNDHQFQFQRNQNQFMPNDRPQFNPMDNGPPFFPGNQGPNMNMNRNMNMNMHELEQMMMAQQFDNFNPNNDNGFNRGGFNPMDSDDPPLERGWGQQQQQHFDRFGPGPGQRPPFMMGHGGGFPDDRRIDDPRGFGRDSPDIPADIPDDEIDEYIMRKQEAIKRRLEQLDKQLISSVNTSRELEFAQSAPRGRRGQVFSDNGDVHYVPNPVAVARNRGRGGGRQGGRPGGEGPSRGNQERNQNRGGDGGRGRRNYNELVSARKKDPFADVDIVPIIRISEERSPSPKRSREDDFNTAEFDAAWN